MQIYALDYYTEFACIGSACRHNCCIGWEIDVDEDTYARYKKTEGAMGKRLCESIKEDVDGAHFKMQKNGRCPFLTKDNLCDIILTMGEDALCQICTDHPRYRNFFQSRTEIGLGIACEAACALILGRTKRPEWIRLGGDKDVAPTEEESLFFQLREDIFDIIFDADKTAESAMRVIEECYDIHMPDRDWVAVYKGLTVLYPDWHDKVERLRTASQSPDAPDMAKKQLLAYFITRHLADGLDDGRFRARIAFSIHATRTILALSDTPESFFGTARQYAEEIEYAAENIGILLSTLND